MKKNLIYSGILVGVLLVSLVSAGWFTGNAVDDPVTINVYGNARYDKKFEFDGVTYAVGVDFSDDGKEVYLIMTNSELMIVEKLKPLYETGVASFGESFGYMKIEVTRVRESWIRGDYASLVISKGEEPKCDEGYILMKEGCVRFCEDTCTIKEGEKVVVVVKDKKYNVKLEYIDFDKVTVSVDGSLATIPNYLYSRAGGLDVHVKKIIFQEFVGGEQYAVLYFEEITGGLLPEPTPTPTPETKMEAYLLRVNSWDEESSGKYAIDVEEYGTNGWAPRASNKYDGDSISVGNAELKIKDLSRHGFDYSTTLQGVGKTILVKVPEEITINKNASVDELFIAFYLP